MLLAIDNTLKMPTGDKHAADFLVTDVFLASLKKTPGAATAEREKAAWRAVFYTILMSGGCDFTAPKIVWLRNHEPDTFEKVRKVLLPKDFIRLRLTGEYATEVSDASGTSLFNVAKRCWADEMLDARHPDTYPERVELAKEAA